MTGRGDACVLDSVTRRYGTETAVDSVSLRVAEGESVALVGPSGAGKTTLLRLLAGMVAPSSGAVTLLGRTPTELSDAERPWLVGLMHQRLDLVPQLSVKHNISAGALGRWGVLRSLAALVLPVEDPAARTAARRVGVEDKLTARVARLSGGEQQRVAMARLLVQDPRVVLADEPVASLDPARADDLLALLHGFTRADGRTLVASLHAPDLARRHFDRLIGLRDGAVAFDLPAEQVTEEVLARVYRLADRVGG